MAEPLLRVTDLAVSFETHRGPVRVLDGVSFDVNAGETVALVGESGSGKSVTALATLGLIVSPPGKVEGGEIAFRGRDLLGLPEREFEAVRGKQIAMIFQEPMTSLNPVYTAGAQIAEVLRLHQGMGRRAALARAVELLALVGIPSPADRARAYPHELSGGMRQRVMIAMALACEPALLIADEPTTALDVTIQAQILDLLAKLQEKMGMSILFITHDLGIVAEFATRVAVMYSGRIVERGDVTSVFAEPGHPYTQGLLSSVPKPEAHREGRPKRLPAIEGVVPDPFAPPPGCRFSPRCHVRLTKPDGYERCDREEPRLDIFESGRAIRCHFPGHAA